MEMNHSELVTVMVVGEDVVNETDTSSFINVNVQWTVTCFLVLIIGIGVLGNVLIIILLLHSGVYRLNATGVFVLNLSCADLLFLIFCVPFQGTVYVLNHWPYGFWMCKTTHFFQYVTMFASIWLLTVMSVDRYFALRYPLKAVAFRTSKMATRYSLFVWSLSCVVSSPWAFLYTTIRLADEHDTTATACLDIWSEDTFFLRKWMMLFIFFASFAFPTLVVIVMGWLVATSLWWSGKCGNRQQPQHTTLGIPQKAYYQRRRVASLVLVLALALFLCWLPHNISLIWINFGIIKVWDKQFFLFKVTAHMLSYLNSCINPFICYSMSRSLRKQRSIARTVSASKKTTDNANDHRLVDHNNDLYQN
ncbi:Galanin receptor type 2 [Trichinella nelsoni]|uniref:Galanin receptor type 2 n=1 Tax=Trichinella nelsoni TaxID=6336 RepID=A0A0V0RKB3_9BILA|nr:Galanin receptor type 2 [Trichinella nelsoni]